MTLRPALCIIGTTIKVRQNGPPDRGGRVCIGARPDGIQKLFFQKRGTNMKKALAIILSVMMLMSTLVACGNLSSGMWSNRK